MKLTYDPRYSVAYLHLRKKSAEVETIRLSDEVNIDPGPDGTLYGIQLLNAHHQLSDDENVVPRLINEASGQSSERRLPA